MKDSSDVCYLASIPIVDVVNKIDWIKVIDSQQISVEEKFNKIITAIECPREFMALFGALIIEIEERLQRLLPRNSVAVLGFGSFLTDLALKDSDLDLVIDINAFSEKHILGKVKNFFYGRYFADIFNSIIFIKAKVPILRCQHTIGFQCDVSAGNKLSRHNSELIRFYLTMGENYRSFFLIVKFWMKRMGLSEPHLFKNYNSVLLIIFYLQEKHLIPSVEFLQKQPESPPPRIIEGWDSSFLDDISLIPNKADNTSVICLLRDFFHFYSIFEFGFYIISPFLGERLLKPFENHNNRFKHYEHNNCSLNDNSYVCIQDVFKHDFNPGHLITKQAVLDFQNQCHDAEQLCSEAILKNSRVLEKLFTPSKKKRGKKKKNENALIMCAGKVACNGQTEEEICQHWLSDTLLAVELMLNKVALVDKITREEGCFHCSTSHMAFHKIKRAEVAKLIQNTNNLLNLEYQAAISAALLELPECSLETPYNFQLNYKLSRQPTRLAMELNYEKSNILECTHLQALNKNLTQWLRQIEC